MRTTDPAAMSLPVEPSVLLGLIDRIYAAARTPEAWTQVVASLLQLTQCVAGGFHVLDCASGLGSVVVDVGADPEYVRMYREHYARLNPWTQRHGHLVRSGQVVVGLAERDLVGSEYYEDFWRPQGFYDSLSSYVLRDGSTSGALIVIRPKDAPAFETRHVELFRLLTPHLQRATEMQRWFHQGVAIRKALSQALDQLPYGVIVVDERRHVMSMNHAAEAMLEERDGLLLSRGELFPSEPSRDLEFRRLLDGAIATTLRRAIQPGGWLDLPRRSSDRPVSVLVSPLGDAPLEPHGPRPAAVVFLSRDARRTPVDQKALSTLYGLTPAEARVAAALVAGQDVAQITKQQRISVNTARTHVRHILEKTDTRRQGDFIALVLGDVAALWPSSPS